jgi:hypothetical protein
MPFQAPGQKCLGERQPGLVTVYEKKEVKEEARRDGGEGETAVRRWTALSCSSSRRGKGGNQLKYIVEMLW